MAGYLENDHFYSINDNYAKWKPVFDADSVNRQANGSRGGQEEYITVVSAREAQTFTVQGNHKGSQSPPRVLHLWNVEQLGQNEHVAQVLRTSVLPTGSA